MIDSIKQNALKIWFVVSSLALAVGYLLLQRNGRTIRKLHEDAKAQVLANQLMSINAQSKRSEDDFKKAKEKYEALKRRHPEYFPSGGGTGPSGG